MPVQIAAFFSESGYVMFLSRMTSVAKRHVRSIKSSVIQYWQFSVTIYYIKCNNAKKFRFHFFPTSIISNIIVYLFTVKLLYCLLTEKSLFLNVTHYSAIYVTGSSGLFSKIIEITSCICRVTPTRAGKLNLKQLSIIYTQLHSLIIY